MKNAYVEITNICNLACEFCPGHDRKKRHMTVAEFREVAAKLDGKVENLFLHLMGEPLLHPELEKIMQIADSMNVKLKITTNGTLLRGRLPFLCSSKNLRTVCISLHSFEGNMCDSTKDGFEEYIINCLESAKVLAESGKFAVLRLWNLGNENPINTMNEKILKMLRQFFPPEREPWLKTHRGERVADHIFLEWGERFDWPDISEVEDTNSEDKAEKQSEYGEDFCHGLLRQIGILCDGTIVPCCLDRNGEIPLGNIFEGTLDEALSSPRAKKMRDAMAHHRFIEPLCRSCGSMGKCKKQGLS